MDYKEMVEILKQNGCKPTFVKRELKEIPKILWTDEVLKAIASGKFYKGNGLLVTTNKRLIFIYKSLFDSRVESIPYGKINMIEEKETIDMVEEKILSETRELKVITGNTTISIHKIPTNHKQPFIQFTIDRIIHNSINNIHANPFDPFIDLVQRRKQGDLTDDELEEELTKIFQNQKYP